MANENLKMVPKAFGNWKLAGEQMYAFQVPKISFSFGDTIMGVSMTLRI